jgi:hypothetical protein
MNQHQNSKEDYENYHRRAFGVDANMIHDIGDRIDKALNKEKAEIQRLNRVIAKELTENDELGCEYTYINVLREENKALLAELAWLRNYRQQIENDLKNWSGRSDKDETKS